MVAPLFLHLGKLLHHGAEKLHAYTDAALVDIEIPHVQIVLLALARPAAQTRHGARYVF